MLKKLFLIIYSIFLIPAFSFAQKDIKRTWNWYFGHHAALNFSSGSPVAIATSAMEANDDACASISDTAGNLLFYTNGQTIYNRNNVAMPNGNGLKGDPYEPDVLIVPQPLNDSLYYIFNCDTNSTYAFMYSVVNMKLNGGLGDVISKNNFLFSYAADKVTGTRDANDTDVWIVAMKYQTDSFYVYKLTPKGLNAVAVKSKCGRVDSVGVSQMKLSPSGQKLGIAMIYYEGVEILNFNDTTGVVYAPAQPLDMPYCNQNCNAEGVEFSPDETKIYWTYENKPRKYLYQMNLAAGSYPAILASATFIDSIHTNAPSGAADLQLGPDGKIYIAKVLDSSLAIINKPNLLGAACNYRDTGVYLSHGTDCYYGLPNFITGYFKKGPLNAVQKIIPEAIPSRVYPDPNKGRFTIQASSISSIEGEFNIVEIYNMLGEKIASSNSSEGGALNVISNVLPEKGKSWTVNLSNPSAGIYLYRVLNKEGDLLSTGKFIIQ